MIKDIQAQDTPVYILKDTDVYAMDNYCSPKGITLVLQDVKSISASPRGCIAVKNDNIIWYCGDIIDSIDGVIVTKFTDITDLFKKIDKIDISTAKIKKTYWRRTIFSTENWSTRWQESSKT